MGDIMFRRLSTLLIATAVTLAGTTAPADPGKGEGVGHVNMFGKGNPFTIDELPPGRTRSKLESLPGPAQRRAMEWLHRFSFPAEDLDSMIIDDEGGVLYVDPVPPASDDEEKAPGADSGLPAPDASAAADAFYLHSRPGAPHVVHLDFDGHTFSGTIWSSGTIQARPFDLDGSPSTFSAAERSAIAEIWHRVSEDFAAFDIDVTTEEPASFGPYTGRVLITSKTDANGSAMPYNTGGGVAYVSVWGLSDYASYRSPALVYYDNLAKGTTYIAEASAHEFGHNLGLSHDGTSGVTYYAGHGSGMTSWAPIMGNSYYNNVTQWSNGEYAGSNNNQDDIAIIAAKLDLVDDDHGDALGNATPLAVDGNGQVLVSNPETDPQNTYPENKGVIEVSGDRDVFYFSAAAGQVELSVVPAWDAFYRTSKRGANLDIEASLLNASGVTLATSDPESDTDASLSANVPAGTYYLAVTGVGNGSYSDYASAGQYFITGAVTPGEAVEMPPAASFGFGCTNLDCSFTDSSSDSDGSIVTRSWDFGDGATSTAQNPGHTYAGAGTYTVALTVTDNDGLTASVSKSVIANVPNLPPVANFGFSCTGLTCSFSDSSSDSDGSVASRSWDFGDGATSTAQNPGHTYAGAGTYTVGLTVTDNNGAATTMTQRNTVASVQDIEPPQVIITSPGAGVVSGRLTLSAYATDDQQVEQINIYADGKLRCSGTSSASCTWNLRKVSDGDYIVKVEATDATGNLGSDSVTVTVSNGGSNDSVDTPSNKGKKPSTK
jgi:PKD repeat protein